MFQSLLSLSLRTIVDTSFLTFFPNHSRAKASQSLFLLTYSILADYHKNITSRSRLAYQDLNICKWQHLHRGPHCMLHLRNLYKLCRTTDALYRFHLQLDKEPSLEMMSSFISFQSWDHSKLPHS